MILSASVEKGIIRPAGTKPGLGVGVAEVGGKVGTVLTLDVEDVRVTFVLDEADATKLGIGTIGSMALAKAMAPENQRSVVNAKGEPVTPIFRGL